MFDISTRSNHRSKGGHFWMFQHVLFEDMAGRPVARTRRAADGSERRPDGVRLFDLDGAVRRFSLSRAQLQSIWDDAFADLPWAASPVVGAPVGAPGGDADEDAGGSCV